MQLKLGRTMAIISACGGVKPAKLPVCIPVMYPTILVRPTRLPAPEMPAQKTLHRCFCFGRPVSSCQKFLNTHRRRLYTTAYAMAEAVTSTQDNLDTSQPAPEAAADTVLVVESPTKATKVQKYLGPEFKVCINTSTVQIRPAEPHLLHSYTQ